MNESMNTEEQKRGPGADNAIWLDPQSIRDMYEGEWIGFLSDDVLAGVGWDVLSTDWIWREIRGAIEMHAEAWATEHPEEYAAACAEAGDEEGR